MTKNERIEKLERQVKNLANTLGFVVNKKGTFWGDLTPSTYLTTIHEKFRVLFDRLGIENIYLDVPSKRMVKILEKKNVKQTKK